VLFVGGAVVFLACAAQVYAGKLLHRGPAVRGLYRWIRHPQYLALALTGLGLAILWPRFLTLALWTIMVGLYYLLARDEERRMVSRFGNLYGDYRARTGMFCPRSVERAAARLRFPRPGPAKSLLVSALLVAVVIGGGFGLRAYTVAQLPLQSSGRVAALAILPGDTMMLEHRLPAALALPPIASRLAAEPGPVLVYVVPVNYVMQGMIANTGPEWRLFQRHQTMAMIADWIIHPFRHLEHGAMMAHATAGHGGAMPGMAPGGPGGAARRLIFLRVGGTAGGPAPPAPRALFAINAERQPLFFADLNLHTLTVLNVQPLGPGTGWGQVPTPIF
jgi:hypothetical protein